MYASCYFTSPFETVNSCGKTVFKLSDEDMLKRFLMLGTEKGTYYVQERDLTLQHIECVERLIKEKASVLFDIVRQYKDRVFKKDYVLFVLARLCCEKQQPMTRKLAYDLMLEVCTIPTHLFLFIQLYEQIHRKLNSSTGWNSLHKQYIRKWYVDKDPKQLAYLVTKYKNRNGWTHRDVLRLTHIKAQESHDALFEYITKETLGIKPFACEEVRAFLEDYEKLKSDRDAQLAVELIRRHGFTREHIPNTLLGSEVAIWKELIYNMPVIALLRNLNTITRLGVFDDHQYLDEVCGRLTNPDYMKAHPLQVLISLKTYSSGEGFKGSTTWTPNRHICQALNKAYKLSFKNTESTGRRFLLALDISGSMGTSSVCGIANMTAAEISTAMAMIFKEREPLCDVMGFAGDLKHLDVSPERQLQDNMRAIYSYTFGNTDISLPFTWALKNKRSYDCVIVFTDNETNCNMMRPVDALQKYREEMALPFTKLIVIATSANSFSIADPSDGGMLDIVGFDADTHTVINEFVTS